MIAQAKPRISRAKSGRSLLIYVAPVLCGECVAHPRLVPAEDCYSRQNDGRVGGLSAPCTLLPPSSPQL